MSRLPIRVFATLLIAAPLGAMCARREMRMDAPSLDAALGGTRSADRRTVRAAANASSLADPAVSAAEVEAVVALEPEEALKLALEYHKHPGLHEQERNFLFGWVKDIQWILDGAQVFVEAMEALPEIGVKVDDHQGTPIGEGESIAVLGAGLTMDAAQLDKLPEPFQRGLLRACGGPCERWPVVLRFSHTKAVGKDLMRIAMKIATENVGEANILFTETVKTFPIKDKPQVEAFLCSIKEGPLAAAAKYPVAMAELGGTNMALSMHYHGMELKNGALGKDYYSMTPYGIGDYNGETPGAMKFRLTPTSARAPYPELQGGEDAKQALRRQLVEQASKSDTTFNLEIQVATDPAKHPINDATVEWDEMTAPWIPVGELRVPAQRFEDPVTVVNVVGSALWHNGRTPKFSSKEFLFAPGDSPHIPLGDINMFRAGVYPIYDPARQKYLLAKESGKPATCPFADVDRFLEHGEWVPRQRRPQVGGGARGQGGAVA